MISKNTAVDNYIAALDEERNEAAAKLRDVIANNLPAGFEEQMTSMPNYVVPLSLYPPGYHTTKNTPLPFISFASQKNFIALYHFGMYVDAELMTWFVEEYPKQVNTKLDMGKSCIRFRQPEQIPFQLIAELCAKRDVEQWIASYEQARNR
ncbi:MAG: hypothetical protein COB20_10845 [SAR86 cluster bacterium]|uniref:YdhG-like domain-containing protein n=1 Tax=SAR86 cluster bacterium TaxID=2030880 RepID=A0A2A4X2T7_9GAMM|nr:MAG: hypothetical protein COB20_10845 [SAR86 cluster bacterium]